MTVKTSISLTDQQAAFARKLVEEGRYASLSAVLQQGLERMRAEEEARAEEQEVLRAFLENRRTSPTISAEEFERRVDEMLAEKRRAYGLEG